MIGYAPATVYGATIRYGSTTTSAALVDITSATNNGYLEYGYDGSTGASTNGYLCVKYQRAYGDNTAQEWAQWGEIDGAQGYGPIGPRIWTNASTATTTVNFHNWGDEVAVEWRGVYDSQSGWITQVRPKTMAQRIHEIIEARNAPAFIKDRKALDKPRDIREVRARETLCRVIGEEKFRRFLVQGHVTARAKSGLTYQIFPGHGITSVYDKGKMIERLCVVLRGDFPPTDSLIMRYLMILNNEENFRSYANKHHVPQNLWPESIGQMVEDAKKNSRPKTLAEIYADIKSGKHAREVAADIRVAA